METNDLERLKRVRLIEKDLVELCNLLKSNKQKELQEEIDKVSDEISDLFQKIIEKLLGNELLEKIELSKKVVDVILPENRITAYFSFNGKQRGYNLPSNLPPDSPKVREIIKKANKLKTTIIRPKLQYNYFSIKIKRTIPANIILDGKIILLRHLELESFYKSSRYSEIEEYLDELKKKLISLKELEFSVDNFYLDYGFTSYNSYTWINLNGDPTWKKLYELNNDFVEMLYNHYQENEILLHSYRFKYIENFKDKSDDLYNALMF